MKIVLFRSNNIFDSRVNKYHNYYERQKIDYTIVGWDRTGKGITKHRYDFLSFKANESVGGLRAVKNHIRWMCYVYKYLKTHKDITTIHACDLNSAFPAALYITFKNRRVNLIFDACDWFSANFAENKFLRFCFQVMEKFTYEKSNELIICEPERIEQVQFKLDRLPLVLPNIPEIDKSIISPDQNKFQFKNNFPVIAYLGGFADNRFLMELLTLAETEPFNLLIAGYGSEEIVNKCIELSEKDNVKYFGRLSMIDGVNMEAAADVIYAMYCKTNPNNVYAAPNKFYEALLLGKPIITTKGTIVESKVINNNIGWAIEEDVEELRGLINSLSSDEIVEKGNNALNLWKGKFECYLTEFFDKSYSKIIQ